MRIDPIVEQFDAELTAAERKLIQQASDFARRVVAPQAAAWEYDRRVPIDVLREACAAGLASIELPIGMGGHGFRFSAKLRMVEEMARSDFAFPFALVNHHNALVRVAQGQASLAKRLVPRMATGELIGCSAFTEPEHGSDLPTLTTTAKKKEGGWVLDGAKAWITNAAVAGVFITLAQTEPGSGGKGLATFVVEADRQGFQRQAAYNLHGAHAIGAGGFTLSNCFVPDEALLDAPGAGFRRSLSGINAARCYVAAMCAGMLESAIGAAVRHAVDRRAFGQAVIEFQGIRWSLVDAETDLAALRLLAYRAARAIEAGQPAEPDAARAKKFAGERTLAHVAACIQAMGAHGLRSDHPLVRHLIACKTACFTDGTTEMMNERLGKLMIRRFSADQVGE